MRSRAATETDGSSTGERKSGDLKSKIGQNEKQSLHAIYFNIFTNLLCRMWRDI
jgi:hypothetical protein